MPQHVTQATSTLRNGEASDPVGPGFLGFFSVGADEKKASITELLHLFATT
jgi:hypothetical protein